MDQSITRKNSQPAIKAKSYEFYINDNLLNKQKYRHKNNSIDTTKYNIFIFLPKALLFQFFRLANVYFLFIAIIQSINIISPLSKSTAWAPLSFVLCVSLIREALEDWARYKYDKILNSEPVKVFRNGHWIDAIAGGLHIGELVLVTEDSTLPADMILLDSNLEEGAAFIETGTLDGEKTLKLKISKQTTAGFFNKNEHYIKEFQVSGDCQCDWPNPELYRLDGSMTIYLKDSENNTREAKTHIEAKQLLLKGAKLKNTKWIIGFVVYTGHYNKLILNSKKPRMKYSRIEKLMSKLLIVILILQFSFCVILAGLYNVYYKNELELNPYMPKYVYNSIVDPVLNYFTYTLLLNTMIPISLIISLELAKILQGYFISVDVEGYSFVRGKLIKAASVSLNEELGQVNFIFSDKTGTLTCNRMEYKYGVIGDVCYEYIRNKSKIDEGRRLREDKDIVGIFENQFNPNKNSTKTESKYPDFNIKSEADPSVILKLETESVLINEYWKALSICHQCDIEEKENGTFDYTGLSPDDIELVKTAKAQGYDLQKSNSNSIRKVLIGGIPKEFQILNILEFDSSRKRMSIIIRDDNLIKLYIKGADTAVEWINFEENKSRISRHSRKEFLSISKEYVDFFSTKGYRTLLVGMKILSEEEYSIWSNKLHEANLNLENKAKEIESVYAEIEKDIYIIGSTIVEDKLQDGVPETIKDLRLGGIKIWMLTGDKMDTAYNIGLSCNLISKDLKIFKLHGEKGDKLEKLIKEFDSFKKLNPDYKYNNDNLIQNEILESEYNVQLAKTKTNAKLPSYSILVDAVALTNILSDDEYIKKFLDIGYDAVSVICCRVSPLQKSDVVRIMKEYDSQATTLAIGDGGNDVSMIMEAHIGIGLYGEEGMRAVQSGDYALGEFKFLRRLLFFHGRSNNIRVSKMILYFFYKNFVFTIVHFYYAFYNNCSGQTIIDDWFITFYNMIFTAFPLGVLAVSDFDLKPDDGQIVYNLMPFLYKENRDKPIFSKSSFIYSLMRGIFHGLINFFFLVFTIGVSSTDNSGNFADLWFFSVVCFTNIIFVNYY
jgi:phospholipid-transporting ATPase